MHQLFDNYFLFLFRNSYQFFKKKQIELEKYHVQLHDYRKIINQVLNTSYYFF
jgi:hypothetical protein